MNQKILSELQAINNKLDNFVTKDELQAQLQAQTEVTRDELQAQTEAICEDIGKVVTNLFTETDKLKADRKDVAALDKRVTKIEGRIKVN